MSPAQEYAFRFASKLTLYGLCEAQTFGFISLTTMIYTHFAYIIASTAIDVKNWMNQGIDEKGQLQVLHHVATWLLMGVYLHGGPFVNNVTVPLLHAVDATDAFFYLFKMQNSGLQKTFVQLLFVIVWFQKRVFIFGKNNWGYESLKAASTYAEWYAQGDQDSLSYLICFCAPMMMLMLVNFVWTFQIIKSIFKVVLGKQMK